MRNIDAEPATLGGIVVLAIAVWWLANIALQVSGGYTGASALSTQAAAVAILAQWSAIALFVRPITSAHKPVQQTSWYWSTWSRDGLATLGVVLPFWPLLIMFWITSRLSAATLVSSQIIAIFLLAIMLFAGRHLASLAIRSDSQRLLANIISFALLVVIWINRTTVIDWVSP